MSPEDLLYTKEHEWLKIADDGGTIGITEHAQKELGEIVYVELPKVGTKFDSGETFGSVESVKAVSELYIPVSGEVIEVNEELRAAPEKINVPSGLKKSKPLVQSATRRTPLFPTTGVENDVPLAACHCKVPSGLNAFSPLQLLLA